MSSINPGAPYAGTPAPAPAGKRPWYKKKRSWLLIIIGLFILLFAGCAALIAGASNSDTVQDAVASATESVEAEATPMPAPSTSEAAPAPEEPAATPTEEPAVEPEPTETAAELSGSQESAARSAANYLELTSFSRTGLIKQLEFEQFSTEDATVAVDSLGTDWNEQAALKAAEYLDLTSFSAGSLTDQLVFDGFTADEAAYGVSTTDL